MQTENTSTPEGWAKLEHAESGEAPNMMDEGELPVDADGNYVSGVPVDPQDPRTQDMKPAGKVSPPAGTAVSILDWLKIGFVEKLKNLILAVVSPVISCVIAADSTVPVCTVCMPLPAPLGGIGASVHVVPPHLTS